MLSRELGSECAQYLEWQIIDLWSKKFSHEVLSEWKLIEQYFDSSHLENSVEPYTNVEDDLEYQYAIKVNRIWSE